MGRLSVRISSPKSQKPFEGRSKSVSRRSGWKRKKSEKFANRRATETTLLSRDDRESLLLLMHTMTRSFRVIRRLWSRAKRRKRWDLSVSRMLKTLLKIREWSRKLLKRAKLRDKRLKNRLITWHLCESEGISILFRSANSSNRLTNRWARLIFKVLP